MTTFNKTLGEFGAQLDEAFENLAKAAKTTGKGKGKGKTASAKDDGPSLDDVRKSLKRLIDELGNDAATEVLEAVAGVRKASGLDKTDYAKVIEAVEVKLDEAGDDPTG